LSVCLLLSSCNVIKYVTWTGREAQSRTKDDSDLKMTVELEPAETYEIEWSVLPPPDRNYEIRGVRVRYGAEFDEASNVNYPPCRGDG